MGGYLGFGTTPGGDGIKTPFGTIYAGGTNGRQLAAQRYWEEQEKQKKQDDWQKTLGYFQEQAKLGSGDGGPSGLNDEARAAARIGDPSWRQDTTIGGVFGGQISQEALQRLHPLLSENFGVTSQDVAIRGQDSAAARQASQQEFTAGETQKTRDFRGLEAEKARKHDFEMLIKRITSAEEIAKINGGTSLLDNKTQAFALSIRALTQNIDGIVGSSVGGLDPEELAKVNSLSAERDRLVERLFATLQIKDDGQVRLLPGTGVESSSGQNTGRILPSEVGGQSLIPEGETIEERVRRVTGKGENKDFKIQKMDSDFLYGMNDDQKVEKIVEMVRQGINPDVEDLHPTIQDRVTRRLQAISRAGK